MNIFQGNIVKIETSGSLSLVQILVGEILFKTIVLETPETALYLKEGYKINLFFKETEVVIAKGVVRLISMQNKIPGLITNIEKDILLCKIEIETKIGTVKSMITSDAAMQLDLKIGDDVVAMVKTNEVIISE